MGTHVGAGLSASDGFGGILEVVAIGCHGVCFVLMGERGLYNGWFLFFCLVFLFFSE